MGVQSAVSMVDLMVDSMAPTMDYSMVEMSDSLESTSATKTVL